MRSPEGLKEAPMPAEPTSASRSGIPRNPGDKPLLWLFNDLPFAVHVPRARDPEES
jgi:hypothetical protein